MERKVFATLVFQGARFDGAMPVDVLPELLAYRELIVAVARAKYLEENPGRKRVPKGFEDELRLVLQTVENGSAVPVLAREEPAGNRVEGSLDYFSDARQIVERAISAASDRAVSPDFPRAALPKFAAFGRSLRDDEQVIVAGPGTREGARYDRQIRSNLLLLSNASYEDMVDLVGQVRSADKDTEGFTLKLPDSTRLDVRAPSHLFPVALQSMVEESATVRVAGIGLFKADGVLQRVALATEIQLADEGDEQRIPQPRNCATSVEDQMRSLVALKEGWLDGEGHGYEPEQLRWLSRLISSVTSSHRLPIPFVYPDPEGLVRVEWSHPTWEVVATFDLSARTAELLAVDVKSHQAHEKTYTFSDPGAESLFAEFVKRYIGVVE